MGKFKEFLNFALDEANGKRGRLGLSKEQKIKKIIKKFKDNEKFKQDIKERNFIDYEEKDGIVHLTIGNRHGEGTSSNFYNFVFRYNTKFGNINYGMTYDMKNDKQHYIDEILDKFGDKVEGKDISYDIDGKMVTLRIGEMVAIGTQENFIKFTNKNSPNMSFGEKPNQISFAKHNQQTKDDIEFNSEYVKMLEKLSGIFVQREDGNGYYFPLIEKTAKGISPEQMDEYVKRLETKFDIKNIGDAVKDTMSKIKTELTNESSKKMKDWQRFEQDIATNINTNLHSINDIIKKDKRERFYACQVGGSDESDVIVVKDFPRKDGKYNNKSTDFDGLEDNQVETPKKKDENGNKTGYRKSLDPLRNTEDFNPEDEFFYIEAKLDYEHSAYLKFELDLDISGKEPKIIYNNNSELLSKDNVLGEKLSRMWKTQKNKDVENGFKSFSDNVKRLIEITNSIPELNGKLNIGKVEKLPDGFDNIAKAFNFLMLEYLSKYAIICSNILYSMCNGQPYDKLVDKKEDAEKYLGGMCGGELSDKTIVQVVNMNRNGKFKRIYNLFINGTGKDVDMFTPSRESLKLADTVGTYLFKVESEHNQSIFKMIRDYYHDEHNVRYIQIGDDLFRMGKDDPFGLGCPTFEESFEKNNQSRFSVVVGCDLNSIKLKIFLERPKNLYQSSKKPLSKIDVSEIENSNFITSNKKVNESISENEGDGISTSETASDKFEVQVADKIREFFSKQTNPKYNSLQVQHYDEPDKKYWSDIKITNPNTNKNVWVEAKLNKYASLGSSSWKYNEGKWTCTTLQEDDPLLPLLKSSIEKEGRKFIDFCKEYLKKDDIKIPTDLTQELIDAWKKSGNITDTDNEVQFITNKIQIDDFGSKIAEFYKHAKEEPALYMQVADDLYIVDKNLNIFNFKTKDGKELKSLSEAYRIGRIQFRAKGLAKEQKYYYSVYADVKILADKENDDKEYSCSFLDEEKWPVIDDSNNGDNGKKEEDEELVDFIKEELEKEDSQKHKSMDVYSYRCDDEIFRKYSQQKDNKRSLNELINEDESSFLCDSLIKTYPTQKFLEMLARKIYKNLDMKDCSIVVNSNDDYFEFDGKNIIDHESENPNKIFVDVEGRNLENGIYGRLSMQIDVKNWNGFTEDQMTDIVQTAHYMGYDIVADETEKNGNVTSFSAVFESYPTKDELEERKMDYRLKSKEKTYRPDKNNYAFKNKSEKYGGDDYITTDEIVERITPHMSSRGFGPDNWFKGPDKLDEKTSRIKINVNDGKDSLLNVKEIKHSDRYKDVVYVVPTNEDGMLAGDFSKKLLDITSPLGTIRKELLVYMNEEDESTYICNGMKAEGNDIVLDFEWGDALDFDKTLKESSDGLKFEENLSHDKIKNILDNSKIDNKRFSRDQFSKYFGLDNVNWCAISKDGQYLAVASIQNNTPFEEYHYIMEVQNLQKGYGKPLLEEIFKKYKKVWLMADVRAGEDLLNYYRGLELEEFVIPNSTYGVPAYFYYTKECEEDRLETYLTAFYSEDGEEGEIDESEGKRLKFKQYNANYFGKKGNGDCVIRALCIATGYGYKKICEMLGVDFVMGVGYGWADSQGISRKQLDDFAQKYGIIEKVYEDELFYEWLEKGSDGDEYMDPTEGYSLEDVVTNNFIPDNSQNRRLVILTRSNSVKERDKDFKFHCVPVDNHTKTFYDIDSNETAKYSIVTDVYRVKQDKVCPKDSPDCYENEYRSVLSQYRKEVDSALRKNGLDEAEKDIGGEKSDMSNEISGKKIWIDDIREAPEGFIWFKTVREFIKYVDENGLEDVELIDTDHDAGDYQKYGGDYIKCFDYLDFIGAKDVTIHIHSANPVGANNIRQIISRNKEENNWKEVRNT